MNLNENIFRANDIRGVAYEDLTEDVVFDLGKVLGSIALERGQKRFIVGRDGRKSSPDIFEWLSNGVLSSGCSVIDIGICTSPMFYFSTHNLLEGSGVIITGSHNPSQYNGFKIVFDKKSSTSKQIQGIKEKILKKDFKNGEGATSSISVHKDYVNSIIDDISLKKRLNIAIDCGNGAAGIVAKEIFEGIGCKVTCLNLELDGNFPNHHPDPSRPENLKELIDTVKKNSLDIGLAFDGDADRLGIISSQGNIIYPDMQMIIFSDYLLKNNPGGKIVFDVKCTQFLKERIFSKKGVPLMTKTGHTFIKEKMRSEGAILGGEMSGHIFFNDRWPGFDDGIYSGCRFLEILSESPDIFSNLPQTFSTPEINIPASDKEKFEIIEKFKSAFKAENNINKIDIDGLRVEYKGGWGLLRASNTSPSLVMRFEASSSTDLDRIQNDFKSTLKEVYPDMEDF